jgi:hypothetical protein
MVIRMVVNARAGVTAREESNKYIKMHVNVTGEPCGTWKLESLRLRMRLSFA